MTTWFTTRHPGAVEWARRQGLSIDKLVAHLNPKAVKPGDTVLGTLPVNLAAEVCARGARYLNLSLDLPVEARGRELSADDLERYGARLEAYCVQAISAEELCQSLGQHQSNEGHDPPLGSGSPNEDLQDFGSKPVGQAASPEDER